MGQSATIRVITSRTEQCNFLPKAKGPGQPWPLEGVPSAVRAAHGTPKGPPRQSNGTQSWVIAVPPPHPRGLGRAPCAVCLGECLILGGEVVLEGVFRGAVGGIGRPRWRIEVRY